MSKNWYKTTKPEVINDIYGEPHYVAEIKAAPKHGIGICFGRPVNSLIGGRKIILTHELARFIKSTLNHPIPDLDLPVSTNSIVAFRRELQGNPFKTYQKWLDSPSKPSYILFPNTLEDPEYVYDYFRRKFILYSAQMSVFDIPLLKGVDEHAYIHNNKVTPRHILTNELAELLIEYLYRPKELADRLHLNEITVRRLRAQLDFKLYDDRNAWLAEKIGDLIELTPTEFKKKKHPDPPTSSTIPAISFQVRTLLAMKESGSAEDTLVLALLEQDWLKTNKTTKKAVDKHYGTDDSKKIRRAYRILKLANKI